MGDYSRPTICAVGVTLIASDDFVRELKTPPLFWFGPELATRMARGDSLVLSKKQLRESNSRGGLNLLVWEGCFHAEFENNAEVHRTMMTNFIEQHRGFLWKEMIAPQMESAGRLEWTVSTGGLVWDPVTARYADLTGLDPNEIVRKPHVVGTTREMEASRNKRGCWAGSWVGALFDYHPPRLSLSRSEQTLILAALTGGTDQELAMTLGLSLPTVKKMWLSIYRRVGDRQPEIIRGLSDSETGKSERGREKRRRLLAYLREHPEELRPIARQRPEQLAERRQHLIYRP